MACNLQELGFMESFIMKSPANFFGGIDLGAHSTFLDYFETRMHDLRVHVGSSVYTLG